jgi:toxin ParE1/3/4
MARIIIAPEADADMDGIIADVAAVAGGRNAIKYNFLFEKLYERLADYPDAGVPRPVLGINIRIGIVSPYIVIYRQNAIDNTVTVLRIVHGRRHISGRMLRESRSA